MAVTSRPYRISEMDAGQLLKQPVRRQIYDHLLTCENNEAPYTEIQFTIGAGNGATGYHLGVLEKNGLVRSTKRDGCRVFRLAGKLPDYRPEDGPL